LSFNSAKNQPNDLKNLSAPGRYIAGDTLLGLRMSFWWQLTKHNEQLAFGAVSATLYF
jgi:hypothetical protein